MILIFTICDEAYSDYREMWEWLIKRNYPEYCSGLTIIEKVEQQPYMAACKRFVVNPYGLFPNLKKDIYITDIDMMILRESLTIEEFHRKEIKEEGNCYSNSPRNNDEPESYLRLTGLHYATPEWYEKTINAREIYRTLINDGWIGKGRYDDEKMLFNICIESGLKIPPKKPLQKRHHGIHMGTFRNYVMYGPQRLRSELRTRISPHQARQWNEITEEKEYKRILTNIESPVIKKEFKFLETFCRSWGKNK